jgi:hypothetical protein
MHAGYIYLHRRAVHRELGIDAKRKRTEAARRRKNGGAGERQHQNRKLLDQEMKSVNKRTTSSARTKSLGA